MTNFLILGSSGLLGSRFGKYLQDYHGTFFHSAPSGSGSYHYLDISRSFDFKLLIESIKPEIVINCTGYTNVENCEKFPEKCWEINCSSIVNIAEICRLKSVKFIHISTDHYIQHESEKMSEKVEIFPSNQYAFAKLNAEKMIGIVNPYSLIIRTNFFQINTSKPKTFLDKMIIKIRSGEAVFSFKDVVFTPISINQLIFSIMKLIEIDYFGMVNIGSPDSVSKFNFHGMVLSRLGLNNHLHSAVSIDDFFHLAIRPKNMALDCAKFKRLTGHEIPPICDMIDEEIAIGCQELE